MMGVYEVINIESGKSYVGSSVNIKARWNSHINDLRRDEHINSHLQAAFNKYGEGVFSFCVLEEIEDKEGLCDREQFYLDWVFEADDNPYNIARCADAPRRGISMSEELKRRLSNANKGKRLSEEHKRKISEAGKGRTASEETRRKLGKAHKGRVPSEETKRKISEALKGNRRSPETKQKISEALKGRTISEETKRKMSKAHKGKTISEEQRRKISETLKNRERSPEERRRARLVNMGRKHSEETRRKIGEGSAKPYPAFIHCETGAIVPAGRNLVAMCERHGLCARTMNHVKNGKREKSRGWMLLDRQGDR